MTNKNTTRLYTVLAGGVLAVLSGSVHDIEYVYDLPDDAGDCPANTIYRSGGSSIRDRSGGSNIRERDGGTVATFCEAQICPDGTTVPTGEPFIIWHLEDHEIVVASGDCPAT